MQPLRVNLCGNTVIEQWISPHTLRLGVNTFDTEGKSPLADEGFELSGELQKAILIPLTAFAERMFVENTGFWDAPFKS
jgi:hypothetical protein